MTLRIVKLLGEPFAAYSTPSLWINKGLIVEPLIDAIDAGWVPVIQGNVVPEGKVVSGEELVIELAKKLRAEKVLLATDVSGIYKSWPPREGEEPLKVLKTCETQVEALGSGGIDVTGGMSKKLEELSRGSKKAVIRVFDGRKVENVFKAIEGEEVGTLVIPC